MEGVSFAGAEHSTPVPIRPPVQLSTPKTKRQPTTPKVQSAAKKVYSEAKVTPAKATPVKATPAKTPAKVIPEKPTPGKFASGARANRSNGAGPLAARPFKSLPARARTVTKVMVHFVDVENNALKTLPAGSEYTHDRRWTFPHRSTCDLQTSLNSLRA